MKKRHFITRMPNIPGSLHAAAEIIRKYHGNIVRIHYDRRIDPQTVFFEITVPDEKDDENIRKELHRIGYLQESLDPVGFLKFNIYLPNRPGALFEFLNHTTSANANIAFLDFDDRGKHPDRLTVSLTINRTGIINQLLNLLKSRYRIEILEYDTKGHHLDDTVFYLKFAQDLRQIIGNAENRFLMKLLNDINHIVQELTNLDQDPEAVFDSIIQTGTTLKQTTGPGFYADVQEVEIWDHTTLFCIQLPCGGNVFVLDTEEETVLVDSGFGIYHPDLMRLFQHLGIDVSKRLKTTYLTHADADHAGGAGFYNVPSVMHPGTRQAIDKANRAYGSQIESSILEEVYTRLINLFSDFRPPTNISLFPEQILGLRYIFPVISRFKIGQLEFEALESIGGHIYGQVYFLCKKAGVLFTADSLFNFQSLTEERQRFNVLARVLMTSVNVNSEKARKEREALARIARDIDSKMKETGKRCLVCGGHGAISVFDHNGGFEVCHEPGRYTPR